MLSITRKRSVVTLALVTGLLAAAAPAQAGIAVGNPPGTAAATLVSPRDANSGQPTGVVAHRPTSILNQDSEI